MVYYNEIDQGCCDWLSNLMDAGQITPGKIDNRSIAGVKRVHFFAGIGGWDLALQQAGWSEERPVWTGSCPCQSFSSAGKGGGINDHRHLWPEMFRLVERCQPGTVFGEQVSGKLFSPAAFKRLNQTAAKAARDQDQEAWIRIVQDDLEGAGYALGSLTFPACGIGAPMLSQRLYWVATASGKRLEGQQEQSAREKFQAAERGGVPRSVAPPSGERSSKQQGQRNEPQGLAEAGDPGRPAPTAGFWAGPDWIYCQDGAFRPAQPGYEPLAHGVPGKLEQMRTELDKLVFGSGGFKDLLGQCKKILWEARGCRNQQLKGYGNAIVIPQAVAFIESYLETETEGQILIQRE